MQERREQVTVYLTKEEKETLKKFAHNEGRSMTAQIRVSALKDAGNSKQVVVDIIQFWGELNDNVIRFY